jgi:hypothetical protein
MVAGSLLPAVPTAARIASTAALERAMEGWYRDGLPAAVDVRLTAWPTVAQRDGLAAMRSAGTRVSWSHTLSAIGVEAEPTLDPLGAVAVRATGVLDDGEGLVLQDELGRLDTVAAGPGALGSRTVTFGSRIGGWVGDRMVLETSVPRVDGGMAVVLGRVGWEARFLIEALEARGWSVAARLEVAPGRFVTQGRPTPLDPDRVAVVFVVDASASALVRGLRAFLSSGGGVVLYAAAVSDPALERLAPAAVGAGRSTGGARFASTSRAALPVRTLGRLAPDAIVLDQRDGQPVLVGRRMGAGRVLLLAYTDLWRWQMSGDTTVGYQHFVSDLAASAGRRVVRDVAPASVYGAAPLAAIAAGLGTPSSPGPTRGPARSERWLALLAGLVFAALGAEWASRRLRSVP